MKSILEKRSIWLNYALFSAFYTFKYVQLFLKFNFSRLTSQITIYLNSFGLSV